MNEPETKKARRPRSPNNHTTTGFRTSDELWAILQPLLPAQVNTHRFGGGRPRVPDRRCAGAIFFVLRTGCQWQALAQALQLAETEGYIRRFVDEGSQMAVSLTRLRNQQRKHGPTPYLDTVLAAFRQDGTTPEHQPEAAGQRTTGQPLLDPLSERELEVLHLLVRGDSNQEIAEGLVITFDTVKRHVSNIFSKLGVHTRVQAMGRARALGLLSEEP